MQTQRCSMPPTSFAAAAPGTCVVWRPESGNDRKRQPRRCSIALRQVVVFTTDQIRGNKSEIHNRRSKSRRQAHGFLCITSHRLGPAVPHRGAQWNQLPTRVAQSPLVPMHVRVRLHATVPVRVYVRVRVDQLGALQQFHVV